MSGTPELNTLQSACDALMERQQTLLLATRSEAGGADISYAPFVRDGMIFYIYVSQLAKHTHNLIAIPQASVMLIEPEAEAKNLFARQRLTFDCSAMEIARSDNQYHRQLDALAAKFGSIVDVLRTLPDFRLLALTASRGLFVGGFGKAYVVDEHGLLQASPSAN